MFTYEIDSDHPSTCLNGVTSSVNTAHGRTGSLNLFSVGHSLVLLLLGLHLFIPTDNSNKILGCLKTVVNPPNANN